MTSRAADWKAVLKPAAAPLAVLAVAIALAAFGAHLPASLAGLRGAGPEVVLAAAAAVALAFNRGRALVLSLSLLVGFAAYHGHPSRAVFTAVALGVPLNALAALVLPERGARDRRMPAWLVVLAAEALLLWWLGGHPRAWDGALASAWLRSPPTPLAARLAFAAAFALAVARAWPHHAPHDVGVAGALAAFFIACEWPAPGTFALFLSAAGAIVLVSVLQESHRLAFRDGLTGLPNRRALEEALRALGPAYAVAMVDVDHFKAFNDTHGHDIGDQVLRLVAARLADVGAGGRSFRYGGEEFTVLFPDRGAREAAPALEALRAEIAEYRMAVRGDDRPKKAKQGSKRRGVRAAERRLSVTVSIGLAEPGAALKTPAEVLKAADEALYRAKQAGRNRLATDRLAA